MSDLKNGPLLAVDASGHHGQNAALARCVAIKVSSIGGFAHATRKLIGADTKTPAVKETANG